MKGLVFNIKRYAIHDGPGIRVTVFLKGCTLECWWCHNPEGISPEVEYIERIDRIGEKEFKVKEKVGKEYSIEDILEILSKEKVFIEESGGGVTFSGGEPLNQIDFLEEALTECKKEGVHTAVDTSGLIAESKLKKIMPITDLFLFDLKQLDTEKHKRYTGVHNKQILSNYNYLLGEGKDVILRIPVIPGYNDDEKHLKDLKDYLYNHTRSNLKRVDLLPYHRIGSSKYRRFNLEYRIGDIEQPTAARMNELKEYFSERGLPVKVGG